MHFSPVISINFSELIKTFTFYVMCFIQNKVKKFGFSHTKCLSDISTQTRQDKTRHTDRYYTASFSLNVLLYVEFQFLNIYTQYFSHFRRGFTISRSRDNKPSSSLPSLLSLKCFFLDLLLFSLAASSPKDIKFMINVQ